jgi:hypothetical protein
MVKRLPSRENDNRVLGTIAWSAGIKDITGYQKDINSVPLNRLCQPGQKCLEFLVPLSAT